MVTYITMVCKAAMTCIVFLTVTNIAKARDHCKELETCIEGQKCLKDSCVPCDSGTFREERSHHFTQCLPWKEKPPGYFWVVAKNGTAHSDREWKCAEGYEKLTYTQDDSICSEIHVNKQSSTVSRNSTKTLTVTTEAPLESKSSADLSVKYIVLIVILGSCLIVAIVLIVWCKIRRRDSNDEESGTGSCESKAFNTSNGFHDSPERHQTETLLQSLDSSNNTNRENDQSRNDIPLQSLAVLLSDRLVADDFESLLVRLPCKESYNPRVKLTYKLRTNHNPRLSYIETFIEWRHDNLELNLFNTLSTALKEIGNNELISLKDFQDLCHLVDAEETAV